MTIPCCKSCQLLRPHRGQLPVRIRSTYVLGNIRIHEVRGRPKVMNWNLSSSVHPVYDLRCLVFKDIPVFRDMHFPTIQPLLSRWDQMVFEFDCSPMHGYSRRSDPWSFASVSLQTPNFNLIESLWYAFRNVLYADWMERPLARAEEMDTLLMIRDALSRLGIFPRVSYFKCHRSIWSKLVPRSYLSFWNMEREGDWGPNTATMTAEEPVK